MAMIYNRLSKALSLTAEIKKELAAHEKEDSTMRLRVLKAEENYDTLRRETLSVLGQVELAKPIEDRKDGCVGYKCPVCGNDLLKGHAPTCALDALRKKCGGK